MFVPVSLFLLAASAEAVLLPSSAIFNCVGMLQLCQGTRSPKSASLFQFVAQVVLKGVDFYLFLFVRIFLFGL